MGSTYGRFLLLKYRSLGRALVLPYPFVERLLADFKGTGPTTKRRGNKLADGQGITFAEGGEG